MFRAYRLAIVVLAGVLAACVTQVERPQTIEEQIAYAEGQAQGVIKSLDMLVCTKHLPTGQCAEPGRPLSGEDGMTYLSIVAQARAALKISAAIPPGGAAPCLGAVRERYDCLSAARAVLLRMEGLLRDMAEKQKRGG